jgi:hypothetical protein
MRLEDLNVSDDGRLASPSAAQQGTHCEGSVLLEHALATDCPVLFDYRPEGLTYEIKNAARNGAKLGREERNSYGIVRRPATAASATSATCLRGIALATHGVSEDL